MKPVWYAVISLIILVSITYFITKKSNFDIPSVGYCTSCDGPSETFSDDFSGMNEQVIYTTAQVGTHVE